MSDFSSHNRDELLRKLEKSDQWDSGHFREKNFESLQLNTTELPVLFFEGCGFQNVQLVGENHSPLHFTDCRFDLCQFDSLQLRNATFERCQFVKHHAPTVTIERCQFHECRFAECDLRSITLSHCMMESTGFEEGALDYAEISATQFRRCAFNNQAPMSKWDSVLFRHCSFGESFFDEELMTFTNSILMGSSLELLRGRRKPHKAIILFEERASTAVTTPGTAKDSEEQKAGEPSSAQPADETKAAPKGDTPTEDKQSPGNGSANSRFNYIDVPKPK